MLLQAPDPGIAGCAAGHAPILAPPALAASLSERAAPTHSPPTALHHSTLIWAQDLTVQTLKQMLQADPAPRVDEQCLAHAPVARRISQVGVPGKLWPRRKVDSCQNLLGRARWEEGKTVQAVSSATHVE